MYSTTMAEAMQTRAGRFFESLVPALWLGLVAGLIELAILGWRRHVGHHFLYLSQDIVWLTPLAYALLALAAVTVLRIAAWMMPRLWTERARVAVAVTMLCGSLLSLAGGLSKWSMVLLGMGVGAQGSRLLAARTRGVHRLVRATLPLLVALIVVAGAGGAGLRAWREDRAVAALPPVPPDAPNVLLIVWDAVRAASVSALGYERQTTPQLFRWATGGVLFRAAYATTSWTLPSHASLFTGRDAYALSADWDRPLDRRYSTLAELFGLQGYRTGGFTGNLPMGSYEGGLQRGFATYEDYRVSPGELLRSLGLVRSLQAWWRFSRLTGSYQHLGRRSVRQINGRFLHWLDGQPSHPFFAFLNYFDAHDPYLPRPPFDTMFGAVLPRQDPRLGALTAWTTEGVRAERDSYERAIAGVDADFGSLLQGLDRRGVLRNTLIVVTADHGEEFGEHGTMAHGGSLYLPVVHVPLVLWFPGRVPAGRVVDRAVSLRDIPATIQSLTGMAGPRVPGRSLEATWNLTDSSPPVPVLSWVSRRPEVVGSDPDSLGNIWSALWQDWRYVRDRRREELYFLPEDPTEHRNLIHSGTGTAILPQLRRLVDSAAASRRSLGLDRTP